ncbi:MAG: hypothetical protein HOW73_47455 [Polyangiaceae bacterium]|nr:hypothetical protein [Polyangiaceae bacterium]
MSRAGKSIRTFTVCLALAASGCQLILGIEDHQLDPTGGSGGGTAGAPNGGSPSNGGSGGTGGEGGEPPVELELFGDPEDLKTDLGSIEELVMAEDGSLFYLERVDSQTHQVQRRSSGGVISTIGTDLSKGFGLALTDDYAITATSPADGSDSNCHILALDRAGIAPPRDIVHVSCAPGEQALGTLGAAGTHVVFSDLRGSANLKSRVLKAEDTDDAAAGTVIGYGTDKDTRVASAIVDGSTFYWIDSDGQSVLESDGGAVSGGQPPGEGVTSVANGLGDARELVQGGAFFFVATATGVYRVSVNGDVLRLAEGQNPHGLSVDSAFVYWAEDTRVRAARLSDLALSTVASVGDDPCGTATDGSAVYFGTTGGRIVRVAPLPR